MTAQELAAVLTGSEYPMDVPRDLAAEAKTSGLVVVYGASDDLMEFDGAFRDEFGCYEGGAVRVDAQGVLPSFDEAKGQFYEDEMEQFFLRRKRAAFVRAVWDAHGYSWTYETNIPHETFEVLEDGEKYCRGIVFALADVPERA